jgi:hypothetical protein
MKNLLALSHDLRILVSKLVLPDPASRSKTVVLSILLHTSLLFAIGFVHFDTVPGLPTRSEAETRMELVLAETEIYTDRSNSDLDFDGDAESYPSPIVSRGEQRGVLISESEEFVANTETLKEEVMMASLASLSELRESISFGLKEISANSKGTFIPLHGSLPDTDYLANGDDGYGFGLKKGLRIRVSSGGGNCPDGSGAPP